MRKAIEAEEALGLQQITVPHWPRVVKPPTTPESTLSGKA